MIIVSHWDDEAHTVLHTIISDHWNWTDLHDHDINVVAPMIEAENHSIAIIVDLSRYPWISLDGFQTNIKRAAQDHRLLNVEMVVFVTPHNDIGMLIRDAHRLYGARGRFYTLAPNVDNARTMIVAYRSRPATSSASHS